MAAPQMTGVAAQGVAAHGPMPAGMLRISKGHQERYVWPVHLAGWLALGWRVAGAEAPSHGIATAGGPSVGVTAAGAPSDRVAAAAPPAPITAAAATGELAEPDAAQPPSPRGRRGRRRKQEQEQPPAAIEPTPEPTGTSAEADAADPEPPVATDLAAESAAEFGDDSTTDGELSLSALPDDLFGDDPLI